MLGNKEVVGKKMTRLRPLLSLDSIRDIVIKREEKNDRDILTLRNAPKK